MPTKNDDRELERDEHGEYDVNAGSTHPVEPDNYTACNATLKFTFERYGERRYCTGMALCNFYSEDHERYSQFCKHHRGRENLMKLHEDNFKTGARTKNHDRIFKLLEPHKKIVANNLYKSLITESKYDFAEEIVELESDVSDKEFGGPEADTLVMDHPIPTAKEVRCKALWYAALDFIVMENIREEQFKTAINDDVAVGERMKVVSVTDDGFEIMDEDEHHLNLTLSRIQKDYKEHLKFGGVTIEEGGEDATTSEREWVVEVHTDDKPAATHAEGAVEDTPLADIEMPTETE